MMDTARRVGGGEEMQEIDKNYTVNTESLRNFRPYKVFEVLANILAERESRVVTKLKVYKKDVIEPQKPKEATG